MFYLYQCCIPYCQHGYTIIRRSFKFLSVFIYSWLMICLTLKNFSLIWRCHDYRWRAAKLKPMLGAQGLEQIGIFIMPHLLWHGASVFPVSSEGPPHSVTSYDIQGILTGNILWENVDFFIPYLINWCDFYWGFWCDSRHL